MSRKKIVVTGNKGFVGSNLATYFKDHEILGVSRAPTGNEINYEQLNVSSLDNSDVFIHLAGKAHDLKRTSEDQEYFAINTELTKDVFDVFLKSDCEAFIYMSSVKAVTDKPQGVVTEKQLPNPITVYGKSKLAAERYILSADLPKNKRVYILRPCMIHGPSNRGNLNLLYRLVANKIPWPLASFDNMRSFCSIENLIFIINELIENTNIPSGIYNVSDDMPLSTNAVIRIIAQAQNINYLSVRIPKSWIRFIARWGDKGYGPLDSERLEKLTESYVVSNNKITGAMKRSLPVSSENGLLHTVRSFNNND